MNMQVNWLSCKPGHRKKIVLGIVYRPPIGNTTEFIEYLEETIPNIPNIISHETHLLGDFNIDYLDANLSETKKLKQATIPFGLTQYIDINTRITVETSSCIDLHFTDCKHVANAGVVHLGISDHSLTFIRKKQRPPQNKNSSFLTRSYRNLDEPVFVESIRGIDWSLLIDQQPDIEVAWKAVEMKLGQLLDHQCPIKKVKTHKIRVLWMTTELLAAIKLKDNLMIKARTTRSPDDWIVARKARNKIRNTIKRAKRKFYVTLLMKYKNDGKKFWRVVREVIAGDNSSHRAIRLKDEDTNSEIPLSNAASVINTFFATIGSKLDTNNTPWDDPHTPRTESFSFIPFTENEVKKHINAIDESKATGIPYINGKVIKLDFKTFPYALTKLFNLSLTSCKIPSSWKKSEILPIPKITNATDPSDYRPIALLCTPVKLLEKLITAQVNVFLESQKLLVKIQDGYRKNRNTATSITAPTNDIYSYINNKSNTLAIFIDFRKAFDCVNHIILLKKLHNMGFDIHALNWFREYLSGRTQITLANGLKSQSLPITCGVPQGSILGPILFLIFVNDITDTLTNCRARQYADDTVLYLSLENNLSITNQMQTYCNALVHWCLSNKMHLNAKKN